MSGRMRRSAATCLAIERASALLRTGASTCMALPGRADATASTTGAVVPTTVTAMSASSAPSSVARLAAEPPSVGASR